MSKFYGVEMVTVSKAGLAELEQALAHERGLREAAEATLATELLLANRQHEESIVTASDLLKQLETAEAERDTAVDQAKYAAQRVLEILGQETNRAEAAEAELKVATGLVREMHDLLDDENASENDHNRQGKLPKCIWCEVVSRYDANGMKHADDCILIRARLATLRDRQAGAETQKGPGARRQGDDAAGAGG